MFFQFYVVIKCTIAPNLCIPSACSAHREANTTILLDVFELARPYRMKVVQKYPLC